MQEPAGSKAVLYAAKSTEDKHGSIPDQLDRTRRLAEGEGWTVCGEFTDEGFSAYRATAAPGSSGRRPERSSWPRSKASASSSHFIPTE